VNRQDREKEGPCFNFWTREGVGLQLELLEDRSKPSFLAAAEQDGKAELVVCHMRLW